jgi:hypothetical protein
MINWRRIGNYLLVPNRQRTQSGRLAPIPNIAAVRRLARLLPVWVNPDRPLAVAPDAKSALVRSGRSRISIKSDPDRFGAVITRSRSSDTEGGKAWRHHRDFDGSGYERHCDGSSRISTATKSCQRIIRAYGTEPFFHRSRRSRVTLGKSAAESQAAIDIAQFMKSRRTLGVGVRIAGICLR